mgnify:CR=1 FL=1|jgi:hypothetical protein
MPSRVKEQFTYDPKSGVLQNRYSLKVYGTNNVGFNGSHYKPHQIIWMYMTGGWPKCEIDHINQNKADNRWHNLRDVSHKVNCDNRGLGVHKSGGKWVAQITTHKKVTLYRGPDFFEALCARKSAENRNASKT